MSARVQETLAEGLAAAQSESPEDQSKGLHTLASLTKVSPTNRNLLANTTEAVDILLALSKSSVGPIQALALSVLFNLSLNPNLKWPLARMDVIHHLNSLVVSSPASPRPAKLAASLICSLAMLDKNKAKFGVAGTVQAIIRALGGAEGPGESLASHHLLSSLAELVQFHGNCTLAARSGAVPMLARVLEGPHDQLVGPSLAILGVLSRFDQGVGVIREMEGIVGLLVDGLNRGCMAGRECAAEVLVRLFEQSEECAREAAAKPGLTTCLADLSIRGSVKAREMAGFLMRKLMDANLEWDVHGNPTVILWDD